MATRRASFRIGLNICLDGLLAAAAVVAARLLVNPMGNPLAQPGAIAWGAALLVAAGAIFRLPVQYWRYVGTNDLLGVAAASLATAAAFPIGLREAGMALPSPSFPAAHALCLVTLLTLPRVVYRLMKEPTGTDSPAPSALLIGAGPAADLFIRAAAAERAAPCQVMGLVALGAGQQGRRIHGHAILGELDDIPAILARLRAEHRLPALLVITDADLAGTRLATLLAAADAEGVRVARAPRPTQLDPAAGGPGRLELRPVAIEDLLNRDQVALDRPGMAALIQGQRVLVTGAGGSIGSELARQVAALAPSELILLDNGEFALWQIELELNEIAAGVIRRTVIADVRDRDRLHAICQTHRPDLVFHAAALKHVPMVESNPTEGLLTNASGTRNVADAARAAGARAMVVISTDKAVNPTSVMGASKRLAEKYCQALDIAARGPDGGMRCITVRFGNVLGSTGSVVPLFQRQLARGGPLTVTHPDMQRYFMTVREAVGLVLQATVVGTGADSPAFLRDGGIFVLDMGEPVKIVDLARQMIRLAGLRPEIDVKIAFSGMRPGEKLFEEIFHGREPPVPTGFPGLLMATPRTEDPVVVGQTIAEIAAVCRGGDASGALALLGRAVPEFVHNADGSTHSGPAPASAAVHRKEDR